MAQALAQVVVQTGIIKHMGTKTSRRLMHVEKFGLLMASCFVVQGWYMSWRRDFRIPLRECFAFQQLKNRQFQGSRAGLRHQVSLRAVADRTDRDMDLVNVTLSYGQTAAQATLPRARESVKQFLKRSAIQLLRDVADGQRGGIYGAGVELGRESMRVEDADLETSSYIIHYPAAQVSDPTGIGFVEVTSPQLFVTIEDAEVEQASESIPSGSHMTWHHARAFAHSYLMNGREICRATLKFPLAPPIRFNVTLSANFTMEMGFAGAQDSDDGYVTLGLQGTAGFPKVRFPGAQTLMCLFLPRYVRGAMQDAANGVATTFKVLQQQFD